VTAEYLVTGALLLILGLVRLLMESAWRSARPAALLGYAAVILALVLVGAGLAAT
jgi:hypothetical protein